MIKFHTIVLFTFLSINVFSQSTLEKLQGEWLISSVIDLQDNSETRGKYTDEEGYLKFNFKKRNLSITTSPIDKGLKQSFTLDDKEIKLLFPIPIPDTAPEVVYKITSLNEKQLKLTTNSVENREIEYTFHRLKKNREIPESIKIEPIVIKRIIYKNTRDSFVFSYQFTKNTHNYLHPVYSKGPTLGTDLSLAVKYPDNTEFGKISKDLVISIVIGTNGKVEQINKISGVNPTIDDSIMKFLKKSKWEPIEIKGRKVASELLLDFRFLLEEHRLF